MRLSSLKLTKSNLNQVNKASKAESLGYSAGLWTQTLAKPFCSLILMYWILFSCL